MAGNAAVTSVNRDEMLRYLGYAGQQFDTELQQRVEQAASQCEQNNAPRCVHVAYPIDRTHTEPDRVVLTGCDLVLEGSSIGRHLSGACEVVLLACTLGAASELTLRRLSATSPTDAMLYSAAASSLVEAVADESQAAIAQEAAQRGLYVGSRFSPGYGDFPLDIQPAFLGVLDASRRIGLTATRDNLLVPTKSITAVIGLFDTELPPESTCTSCESCPVEGHCLLALQGRTCHG